MQNWHVLITGGSSGIGLKIAQMLAERGVAVHITARDESGLAKATQAIEGRCYTYISDSADREARARLAAEVSQNSGGRLDGLVVNAARYAYTPLLQEDDVALSDYFQTNAVAAFHLVKLCHPMLLAGVGKSILFISSTLSTRPVPGVGAYAASKAAMNSLAQTFALELAGDQIRVNAILPGVVNTPIHDPRGEGEPSREEKLAMLASQHPLGRVGEPEDVAAAARFLLSDEAAWVTGSMFAVDGGISLA